MAERLPALAALERSLEVFPAVRPALSAEQWELRVDRVTGQMARGAYEEAVRTAESLWREGLRDVRLVNPALFGAFQANGPRALPAVFTLLHQALTSAWERLGPEQERKADLADSGVLWLFKSIHKHLDFQGRSQGSEWRAWCESCSRADVEEALQHASALTETLEQRLPGGNGTARLLQVTGWLNENRELFAEEKAMPLPVELPPRMMKSTPAPVKTETAPEVELREEELEEDEESEDLEAESFETDEPVRLFLPENEETADIEGEDEVDIRLHQVPVSRPASPPGMEASPALEQLLRKLSAFDQLVARQDFSRASMVATDVLHVLDHFDPLVYLPALFSSFLAGLSTNAEELEPRMQAPHTLGRRALERLYRADLEAFLRIPARAEDTP